MGAREAAHARPAANTDVHPQGAGGGRLQPGLAAIDVHHLRHGQRGGHQEPDGSADGEEDALE